LKLSRNYKSGPYILYFLDNGAPAGRNRRQHYHISNKQVAAKQWTEINF